MTATERTIARLPAHLRRYVVSQDYAAYTARDHAVWRNILGKLRGHLADKAHPVYLEGLEATGIGAESIPSLDEMNEKLARLGWACVGVAPPAMPLSASASNSKAIASISARIAKRSRQAAGIASTP